MFAGITKNSSKSEDLISVGCGEFLFVVGFAAAVEVEVDDALVVPGLVVAAVVDVDAPFPDG